MNSESTLAGGEEIDFFTTDDHADPIWVVSSIPRPTHRLKIANMTYICIVGAPNAWVRFWQRVLLGWTWEEITD